MTDNERTELLRRAALENAIASNEMEGVVFTPAMRDLLERSSLGLVSEEAFAREALAIALSDGNLRVRFCFATCPAVACTHVPSSSH